jgi:hypothetical protein
MLIIADRRHLARALPALELEPKKASELARRMFHYAIAGLEAAAREAHREVSGARN